MREYFWAGGLFFDNHKFNAQCLTLSPLFPNFRPPPLDCLFVSLVTFVLSSSSYLIDRDSLPKTFLVVDVGKIGTTAVMYYWLSTFDVGDTGTYLFPGFGVVLGLFMVVFVLEVKNALYE